MRGILKVPTRSLNNIYIYIIIMDLTTTGYSGRPHRSLYNINRFNQYCSSSCSFIFLLSYPRDPSPYVIGKFKYGVSNDLSLDGYVRLGFS